MANSDRERAVDLKTNQAMEDVKAGRSEPIDDLLEMIEKIKTNRSAGDGVSFTLAKARLWLRMMTFLRLFAKSSDFQNTKL